jgi:NAD(P)H-flavin reductase/nitrite reductase/ring-hydroxylating ferredoxin subunit
MILVYAKCSFSVNYVEKSLRMFSSIAKSFKMGSDKNKPAVYLTSPHISNAPPLDGFEVVCMTDELPSPKGFYPFMLKSTIPITLVKTPSKIYALSDICPHKEANFSNGDVDIEDSVAFITCPRHRKKFASGNKPGVNFDCSSGALLRPLEGDLDETWKLDTYEVFVSSEQFVYVSKTPVSDRNGNNISTSKRESGLDDNLVWRNGIITDIKQVSSDSFIYSIKVNHFKDLIVGSFLHSWHVSLRLPDHPTLSREYTPLSVFSEFSSAGVLDILIKIYPNGKFTSKLRSLRVGDKLEVSQCVPTVETPSLRLSSRSIIQVEDASSASSILLIGGGTGITPLLQIAEWALEHSTLNVFLFLSFRSTLDWLCIDQVKQLARKGVACHITLSQDNQATETDLLASENVSILNGRLRAETFENRVPKSSDVYRVIVSGPAGMFADMKDALLSCWKGHTTPSDELFTELEA